ncbi:MAG: TonB-dependent receptor plug domain-containing protein [Treponema sp.]|jgi:iron complex outermembrane receptor protein|nr:TonB-dependent receptor plug domain-containing protein [Treponema sp.]
MKPPLLFLLLCCFSFPLAAQAAGGGQAAGEEQAAEGGEDYDLVMEGEGLTVTGEQPQNPALPETDSFGAQRNVVSGEQIREQGSLDILDALRNVPGVVFGKQNAIGAATGTSLYIRGRGYTHPSLDTTISFDGVPRYGLVYGQSMADGIPVFAAESVEVYKYPQPANFGAGYAQVNVSPRYMSEQGWEAEAGFSGGSFLSFAENASFGWRRRRFDIYAAQSWISTEGHVDHSGTYQQSYYLNTGLWINAYWDLRLLFNFVDAETERPPETGQDKDDILSTFKTDTVFSTLTLNNQFDRALGFFKLYYNYTDFNWLDEETHIPGDWSRQILNAYGMRAREVFSFWKGSDITAGLDIDGSKTVNEDHNTTRPSVITDFPFMTLYSPYLALSQYFGFKEKYFVIPSAGLRAYFHDTWDNAFSPQAGLVAGRDRAELHFNYSLGVIYPAPANIQGLVNSGGIEKDDLKKARPEIVHHYEGGFSYRWLLPAALKVSYFYDDGRDRITVSGPSLPGNASKASFFRIQGLELSGSASLKKDRPMFKRLDVFAGGTWITGVRARGEDGNEVSRMPYSPVFSMSAGFKWGFSGGFSLNGDYRFLYKLYGGGLGRTDTFFELNEGSRLDDIHLLNLRLSWSFEHRPWRVTEGELFLSVNNLLDREYSYYDGYPMPGINFMAGGRIKFK